jgi:AmiR/NasT family two-component response regulator
MSHHRKTILVIHLPAGDPAGHPAEIRRLLGTLGHIAVSAEGARAALKALGTVRFDVIFTSIGRTGCGGERNFVQELRLLAPGSAVVGINEQGPGAANEAWMGECDATIQTPLSPSRVQWALDFELRYFGS